MMAVNSCLLISISMYGFGKYNKKTLNCSTIYWNVKLHQMSSLSSWFKLETLFKCKISANHASIKFLTTQTGHSSLAT